ncbi:aspartyl/asparaginyl beta-hydroxylase domain-containing protein [Sphingorhabdus sp.]|uniref:aspartyl/asparaginyl beta-hydroxylase domain-containing protein n=1 Tax=Sphingorhabdus sp. TaxID=1902408 RepID=UPI0037C8BA43
MNRDFAGARRCLAEAVQLDPKRFAAWMKLAAMANAMGDATAALRAANGALAVQPLDSTALLMRAMQLYNLGSVDEAGMAYGRALAQLPDAYAPQMEPVIDIARARYRAWQQRQYDDLAAKVSATTPMTDKLERFIGSALHIEPFEREGPTHYCYPGLGDAGYYDEALFGWMAELEAATDRIALEFEAAVSAEAAQLVPYINYPAGVPLEQWAALNNNRDWTAIHLLQNGRHIEANARHCPELMALLTRMPQPHVAGAGPNAMFSLLAPGAHIPAHTGITNTRLVCHLPLIVPEGCWFRVGDETRLWQRGKAWVFDDTVDHEAMNPSAELRVVMIFDIWHPALDKAEQAGIRAVIEAGGQLHGL